MPVKCQRGNQIVAILLSSIDSFNEKCNSISILLGIHRPLNANSKKEVKQFGAEYRSSKAKGDVKRKGKPDPYAYVPLQKSALNRRKKAKFEGQFKGLVNAANTGSVKGRKAKGLAGQMKKVKIS